MRGLISKLSAPVLLPVALMLSSVALAQSQSPLRIVLPYPPGGGTDTVARVFAPKMAEKLGHPVIVENRPGASGMIAAEYVAKNAPADGNVVLMGDMGTYTVNASLYKNMRYDALEDFAPVTLSNQAELVLLVNPEVLSVNTVDELIEATKKTPDGLFYASPGVGVPHHLLGELFTSKTGAKLTAVPHQGGAAALTSLLGGQTPIMFGDILTAAPHVTTGKLRALAVATDKRSPTLPDIPTFDELGISDLVVFAWQGFAMRKGTPPERVQQVNEAVHYAIADSEVRETVLARGGLQLIPGTIEEMQKFLESETARWRDVIRDANIKVQ